MQPYVLYPPNVEYFSGHAIFQVKPRIKKPNNIAPGHDALVASNSIFQISTAATQHDPTGLGISTRRVKTTMSLNENDNHTGIPAQVIDPLINSVTAEREQWRISKRRQRKRQKDRIRYIEEDIKQLRVKVMELEQRCYVIRCISHLQNDIIFVVAKYFRHFRYGIQVTSHTTQQDFLNHVVSPNVVFNTEFGLDALLRSWRSLSLWFEDVHVEMDSLKRCTATTVLALTTTTTTITTCTLRNVFPHLSCNSGIWIADILSRKLLGQSVVMKGTTFFEWDPLSDHVTKIIAVSDMLTPILRLIGNLVDVSRVFEHALITPTFQWRDKQHSKCRIYI